MFLRLFESPDFASYIIDDPEGGTLPVDMSFQSKNAYTWGVLRDGERFVGLFQKDTPPEWDFWGAAKGKIARYMNHYKLSALARGEKDVIDKALAYHGPLGKGMIPINARHTREVAFTVCGRSWYSAPLNILFISVWNDMDMEPYIVSDIKNGMGITGNVNILIQDGVLMEDDEWEEWGNDETMASPAIRSEAQEMAIKRIKTLSELLHTADTGMKAIIRDEIARLRSTLKDSSEVAVRDDEGRGSAKLSNVAQRAGFETPAEYNATRQQESVEPLFEDLKKRLEWVVSNSDTMTAFLTLDVILPPHSYVKNMESAKARVLDDVRHITNDDYNPNDPASNHMTDEQALDHLKGMIKVWVQTGKWYDGQIPDQSPWEKIIGWVANWVRKRDQEELNNLIRHGNEIVDWFSVVRPNIMALKPSQAAYRSHRWHAAQARAEAEKKEIAGASTLKKVASLEDGVEIYELGIGDLKAEGAEMRHCIGRMPRYTDGMVEYEKYLKDPEKWLVDRKLSNDYYGAVKYLSFEFYGNTAFSIRRDGKRLYTVYCKMSQYGNYIEQFKGKTNLLPGQKGTDIEAAKAAVEWFYKSDFNVTCSDLDLIRPKKKNAHA